MGNFSKTIVIWFVGLLSWQEVVTWWTTTNDRSHTNSFGSCTFVLGGVLGFAITSPIHHSSRSSSSHNRCRFVRRRRRTKEDNCRLEMVKEWLGDIMSGGSGSSTCVATNERQLQSSFEELVGEDWSNIRQQWEAHEDLSEELRRFRTHSLKDGTGRASPMHKLRIFPNSDSDDGGDVRVTLFRDSASWCPYCQKVWTTLEEKRINYRIEYVNMRCYGDKTNEFLRIQPNGNIPVAIIDGITYRQSNDILQVLEQSFQGPNHPSLSPSTSELEDRANTLFRLERQLFGAWMYWLTSRDDASGRLKRGFVQVLQEVEQELQYANDNLGGSFFLGSSVSMVDMMFIPFVERIFASLLYFKAFPIRTSNNNNNNKNNYYPNVNKWMDAMETLSSYQLTKSDYYTHCWDLPPQLGGCVTEDDTYQSTINGLEPGSWHFPLIPHNVQGIEPEWDWCTEEASLEAAERLTYNYRNIVQFAARGAQPKDNINPFNNYMAPLADPKATSNPNVIHSIDVILRLISIQLINNNNHDNDVVMTKLANSLVQHGGTDHVKGVVSSLAYLRDRIGVPRDMKLPAARQLRAHLNWSIQHLQTSMGK